MFKARVITISLFIIFIFGTTTGYTVGITIPAGCKIDINTCTLNVPSDITIAGTLEAGSGAISLTGDWTNSGTFTCGTSTVTFNGTSAQSVTTGVSGWNKIEVTNASLGGVTFTDGFTTAYLTDITPSSNLNFRYQKTYEITALGGLNLNGQAVGSRIVLRRNGGVDPAQWRINPSGGGWTVSYVDVKDSVNSAVMYINPLSSLNSGNNLNWFSSLDSDGDGMPGDWELFYGLNPNDPADALLDSDGDGLNNLGEYNAGTIPTDSDSDDDLMPDGWEVAHHLNPLLNDADGDADSDGWTNLEEYEMGSDPTNACPAQPMGSALGDEASLAPILEGSAYSDAELDPHILTQWQIASGIDFADTELIFDDITSLTLNKETIQIPLAMLSENTVYHWRVRYSDSITSGWSQWSSPVTFTTDSLANFLAGNEGIEVIGTIGTDMGNVVLSFKQDINNLPNVPSGYQFYNDIFSFRIEGITPGATVQVSFQLNENFQPYHKWLKYYSNTQTWDDTYAAHIVRGIGTNTVTLEFKDGGFGDIDGLENGVIVDPSGPAIKRSDDDDDDSFCFIATAAYGTPMAEEVKILREFRDKYLVVNPIGTILVNTYYKVSPPVAEFIKRHPVLKNMARNALKPIIWMSERVVSFSLNTDY